MKYLTTLIILISLTFGYQITPEVKQTAKIDFVRMIRPNEGVLYRNLKKSEGQTTAWHPNSAFNIHKIGKPKKVIITLPRWQFNLAYIYNRDAWDANHNDKLHDHWSSIPGNYIRAFREYLNIKHLISKYGIKAVKGHGKSTFNNRIGHARMERKYKKLELQKCEMMQIGYGFDTYQKILYAATEAIIEYFWLAITVALSCIYIDRLFVTIDDLF